MARTTKGRLYKRGKQGLYYLQYYANGMEHREVLKDEHGESITKEKEARKAADALLAPLRYKDAAQRLRTLVNELSTMEQKAEIAAAEIKNKTATLASGWELYLKCPSCPETYTRYGKAEPPQTSRAYIARGYFRSFLAWIAQHHPEAKLLSDVSEEIAIDYISFLKEKYGANGSSVNTHSRIVRQMFSALIEDEKIVISRDPFKRIKTVKESRHTKEALTIEETQRLITAAPDDETRLLVIVGFCTGLRLGDCCTLQWGEVDLARRIISRIPNKMRDRVPNPESVRIRVGIPGVLFQALAIIPEGQRTGAVMPLICDMYQNHRANLYHRITLLFRAANIETVIPGSKDATHPKGIICKGFHSLRHLFVSMSAEAGAPQHVIQRIVGHSSPLMTMHYTHIGDAALRASADILPALPLANTAEPTENPAEVIDALPVENIEPERAELHRLADSLTVEEIREILNHVRRA